MVKAIVPAVALLHAAMFLWPSAGLAVPEPRNHRQLGPDLVLGLVVLANQVVAPLFAVLQFFPQYMEMQHMDGDPGALSLLSLGVHTIVLCGVAVRWLRRIGRPNWGNKYAPFSLWNQWGMLSFNYFFHAFGCAFLLAAYNLTRSGGSMEGIQVERALHCS